MLLVSYGLEFVVILHDHSRSAFWKGLVIERNVFVLNFVFVSFHDCILSLWLQLKLLADALNF